MIERVDYKNALVLMTSSYRCNDNCPYCRSKSDHYFPTIYKRENFTKFVDDLKFLYEEGYHFNKFILSGNGEPTLYAGRDLFIITEAIYKYKLMFDEIRLYTNGYLFDNDLIFNLLNTVFNQYVLTIVSLDLHLNDFIKNHKGEIWNTENIQKVRKIKLDIARTIFLNIDSFCTDLDEMLKHFPNIKQVLLMRLKNNIINNTVSKQNEWMNAYNMTETEKEKLYKKIDKSYNKINDNTFLTKDGIKILFGTGEKEIEPWLYWNSSKSFYNFEGEKIDKKQLIKK